jgi:hypothetical protein
LQEPFRCFLCAQAAHIKGLKIVSTTTLLGAELFVLSILRWGHVKSPGHGLLSQMESLPLGVRAERSPLVEK